VALTRDQILSASLAMKAVACPEWGGTVYVRELTGAEFDEFRESGLGADGQLADRQIVARLVCRCACDESGTRLFADEDMDALNGRGSGVLFRVFRVAQELCGVKPDEGDDLGNSAATTNSDSGSV